MRVGKILAAALLVACAGGAQASVTFDIAGLTDPTNNKATATVHYDNVNKLTVTLKNISNFSAVITGFAFNVPTAVTGLVEFAASGFNDVDEWVGFFSLDDIGSPQAVGVFDVGSNSSGGSSSILDCTGNGNTNCDLQNGNPNASIEIDETGEFVFTLAGAADALDDLTTQDFTNLFSTPECAVKNNPNCKGDEPVYQFATRFQRTGSDTQGSDVGVPVSPIPVPAALPLLALGLAGFGAYRHRQRRKAA